MIERETGNKKSDIQYFTDSRPVDKKGNPLPFAVAMVAKCVAHYRRQMRPLKTIWLGPAHYNQFEYWVKTHCLEHEADLGYKMLTFDGVEIEKMSAIHIIKSKEGSEDMDWDFYPTKTEAKA